MYIIKLKRFGCKKRAFFRIVGEHNQGSGKAVNYYGFFCPFKKTLKISTDDMLSKIKQGAKLTKSLFLVLNRAQKTEFNINMVK